MKRECKICKSKVIKRFRSIYDNRHGYPGKFSIYECPNCGFMQTEPRLTSGKLSNVYTNYYPKRDADVKGMIENIKHLPSKKEIYRQGNETDCHFQTEKGQNVLDIGCGTCQSLLFIKRLGGNAWGLDPDKNSQNVAKELKLRFHLGTIHNCKFPKKHFDLITASQVLEHEPDPIAFLKDTRKFLKKGGKIVMSFPNTGALYRKIWGRNWLHWHVPYHLNHFNRKSLKIMARKTGFKIISLRTVTPNLWTILQIRSYINSPKMGQRVPMWDGHTNKRW
ncbi:MAG: class I SAM-dependent methyltransferase [Candidatus Woesebacteria bacterium]|nr:class I SAM-dependent methyltransferase [Candidatus Woesebacteria bacterium]